MVEKRRELWGCFMCGWSLQHATAVWLFVGRKGWIPAVLGKFVPFQGAGGLSWLIPGCPHMWLE